MKWNLRTATPADAAGVEALLEASYPALMRPAYEAAVLEPALPVMTRAIVSLLSSGRYYIVEIEGGSIVGCGGWSRERPGAGDIETALAHIRHFATHPDWIGRGIGKSIYGRCKAAAHAAGIRRFECHASLNAERFYTALGFRAIRQIDIPIGSGALLPAVLMEADL